MRAIAAAAGLSVLVAQLSGKSEAPLERSPGQFPSIDLFILRPGFAVD